MLCPFCGNSEQQVVNKRPTYKGYANWRRRRCLKCLELFTTHEFINLTYIKVIKKNGMSKVFQRSKLYAGIFVAYRGIKHMDSGDAAVAAEEITREIEKTLISKKTKKITTQDLAAIAVKMLRKDNLSAFVNYASYYTTPAKFKKMFQESENSSL